MESPRPDFSTIVWDNERAVAGALDQGNFVQAFLLTHALGEALLCLFLRDLGDRLSSHGLVWSYSEFLGSEGCASSTFMIELEKSIVGAMESSTNSGERVSP